MTLTNYTCAVCSMPKEGIPFGPPDAECCWDCWERAGDYNTVRMHAHGPCNGSAVRFHDPQEGPPDKIAYGCVRNLDIEERTAAIEIEDHYFRSRKGDTIWLPWTELKTWR